MALSLFAVIEGYLDKLDVSIVGDFEKALHDFASSNNAELLEKINKTGDYSDEIAAELKAVCDAFKEKGTF
jgi:F-type H+-transporting ATPase subunit alpha